MVESFTRLNKANNQLSFVTGIENVQLKIQSKEDKTGKPRGDSSNFHRIKDSKGQTKSEREVKSFLQVVTPRQQK